ncbi:MAG: fimbria/pilus outer membrane usher protein [Plesiomonas sp.]
MKIIKKHDAIFIITFVFLSQVQNLCANEVEFDSRVLNEYEQGNVDFSLFSHAGGIVSGDYILLLKVNKKELGYFTVKLNKNESSDDSVSPCITPEMLEKFGLTQKVMRDIQWEIGGACLKLASLPGLNAVADFANATLNISIPHNELEYSSAVWDPIARWDDGVFGILFDYNMSAQVVHREEEDNSRSISGNGTAGINIGAWRLRGDWQKFSNAMDTFDNKFEWSRIYAYRSLREMKAKLILGESYLGSDIFDSFRFVGASLASDESMIAPHLRGYSPEISGVAKTAARVIITQQGRVIYDTQVAPGSFRIQDLNNAVSGTLDVRIEEQDGTVQTFQVNTANIPYLTRPGKVRYKLAAGKTSQWEDYQQGEQFGSAEFSWGVSNGWSLYGGGIASQDYQATSLGIGRDLLVFGAISADITSSWSQFEQKKSQGSSYRLSYSKRFDEYNSQISFAGYRFADQEFMSMSNYLNSKYGDAMQQKKDKEMYNISLSKSFQDLRLSTYISYNHATYWNQKGDKHYNITASKYMDLGGFRNLSLNASVFTTEYENDTDNGMYLSMSIPFGDNGSVTLASDASRDGGQRFSYYDKINTNSSYNFSVGVKNNGEGVASSGSLIYEGSYFDLNANVSKTSSDYSSARINLRGGVTLTPDGGAFHRMNQAGGTRLLVDTEGVASVPIKTLGADTHTNRFGKAVVNDVSGFYRNSYAVNISDLPENVDVTQSIVQATLTEGAIGYRQFPVVSGEKMMVTIKNSDHSSPPLGAEVTNGNLRQIGIVGESGMTYLSGLKPAQTLFVSWNGRQQCKITLPDNLMKESHYALLLLCK